MKAGDVIQWVNPAKPGQVNTALVQRVYDDIVAAFPCYWWEQPGNFGPAAFGYPMSWVVQEAK